MTEEQDGRVSVSSLVSEQLREAEAEVEADPFLKDSNSSRQGGKLPISTERKQVKTKSFSSLMDNY